MIQDELTSKHLFVLDENYRCPLFLKKLGSLICPWLAFPLYCQGDSVADLEAQDSGTSTGRLCILGQLLQTLVSFQLTIFQVSY